MLQLLREWLDVPIDVGDLVRGTKMYRSSADGVTTDARGALDTATWLSFIMEAKPWISGSSRKGQDDWHLVGGT